MAEVSGTVKIEEVTVVNPELAKRNVPNSFRQKVIRIAHTETEHDAYALDGAKPKVKAGDKVKAGQLLFTGKDNADVVAARAGEVSVEKDKVVVTLQAEKVREYPIVPGFGIYVKDGQKVEAGDALTEGSMDLQQLYRAKGKEATQKYIIKEIQQIYSMQGQKLNDKLPTAEERAKNRDAVTTGTSNAALTTKVKTALANDRGLSTMTNIDVDSDKGVVTLKGKVDSADAKKKAEQVAKTKAEVRNGIRYITLDTAIAEGLLHFVPEPRSPHGADVSPDGNYVVVGGKLDPFATVYDIGNIRKAIAETMAALVRSINSAVEHSLSPRGIKWRIESWRTGVPYAQVVIKHALIYRVEQAFLIHAETGLLLAHATAPGLQVPDADLISGMLTAIQDFVSDSFGA